MLASQRAACGAISLAANARAVSLDRAVCASSSKSCGRSSRSGIAVVHLHVLRAERHESRAALRRFKACRIASVYTVRVRDASAARSQRARRQRARRRARHARCRTATLARALRRARAARLLEAARSTSSAARRSATRDAAARALDGRRRRASVHDAAHRSRVSQPAIPARVGRRRAPAAARARHARVPAARSARVQLRALLHAGPFVPELAARGMLRAPAHARRDTSCCSAEDAAARGATSQRRARRACASTSTSSARPCSASTRRARASHELRGAARAARRRGDLGQAVVDRQPDRPARRGTPALERLRDRACGAIYARGARSIATERRGRHRACRSSSTSTWRRYRDLRLTLELFARVLDEPELRAARAPASCCRRTCPTACALQRELTAWARSAWRAAARRSALRVVKGANLLTERVESAARGWPLPIFGSKARGRRELQAHARVRLPARARAPRCSSASRATTCSTSRSGWCCAPRTSVERARRLRAARGHGRSAAARAAARGAATCSCTAPIVHPESMQTAIAYLMRRLDENTAEENFLRNSFGMQRGRRGFERERAALRAGACSARALADASRRTQDRSAAAPAPRTRARRSRTSRTPTSRSPHNRALDRGDPRALAHARSASSVALQIGGELRAARARVRDGFDPSRPGRRAVPLRARERRRDRARAGDGGARRARAARRSPLAERRALLLRGSRAGCAARAAS